MKTKFEKDTPTQKTEAETYIDYVKLNQTFLIFKHWSKNKNTLIDRPCGEKSSSSSIYSIAKLVNKENPLSLMMPEVYFPADYSSADYESWEDLYLKNDLFISQDNLHQNHHRAYSLETVFLTNKHNGFLRTDLRYDDRQLTTMSIRDQQRFLAQLKERYPSYYEEYVDAQPSQKEASLIEINIDKINHILNVVELMLVLSCHKGGLRSTTVPGSVTDYLSAYGYQLLIHTLSENLNDQDVLNQLWAKNIHNDSEKTVADLIKSALNGACTTTLGLYWLGLIKEYRKNFTLRLNHDILTKIYENFSEYNPTATADISKSFFSECLQENMRYIAAEMLNSMHMDDGVIHTV